MNKATMRIVLGLTAALVALVSAIGTAQAADTSRGLKQAESMTMAGGASVVNRSDDSGSSAFLQNSAENIQSTNWAIDAVVNGKVVWYNQIWLRAAGVECFGWPTATVYVSGVPLFGPAYINSTPMHTFISTFAKRNGGTFSLQVTYPNGGGGACSDLYVDWIRANWHT